jgi:hypothetical protein
VAGLLGAREVEVQVQEGCSRQSSPLDREHVHRSEGRDVAGALESSGHAAVDAEEECQGEEMLGRTGQQLFAAGTRPQAISFLGDCRLQQPPIYAAAEEFDRQKK